MTTWKDESYTARIILVMGSANEKRRYYVYPIYTQNDPWYRD